MGFILSNKRGLVSGIKTFPVKIPTKLLVRLFEIEQSFPARVIYSINDGGTERLENHLANADFQVLFTLARCCDAFGYLNLNSKRALYQRLVDEFEVPISDSQFYESIEKLIRNGLLLSDHTNSLKRYRLNHYINDRTEKINRYVLVHPIVYSKEFKELSLSAKKLFFMAYEQTGGDPGKVISRNFKAPFRKKREYTPFVYKDLRTFLHKTQDSHIVDVIEELKSCSVKKFKDIPLISNVKVSKNTEGGLKVSFSISPEYVLIVSQTSKEGINEPLDMRSIYKQKANFLVNYCNKLRIGEILADSQLLNRLILLFKRFPSRIVKISLKDLKDYVTKNKKFPNNIYAFLHHAAEQKSTTKFLNVLTEFGMRPFVELSFLSEEERSIRLKEFKNFLSLSGWGIRKFKNICQIASPYLKRDYFVPVLELDYKCFTSLHSLGIDAEAIKKSAITLRVDPYNYNLLEDSVFLAIKNGLALMDIEKWLYGQLKQLPKENGIPIVSRSFKIENYLKEKIVPLFE